MVATPWGHSETLREGQPALEVSRGQRELLFAAMVACVSERGYAPVTVADLLELSGVSEQTFYELFGNKLECFEATLDAVVDLGLARVGSLGARARGEEWEAYGRRILSAFAAMVTKQPAAARVALVDSPAAGNESVARFGSAVEALESVARRLDKTAPRQAEMPADLLTALVGAVLELTTCRLRHGRERELPRALGDASHLLLSYQPPPQPLRLSVEPPSQGPERLEAADHTDRTIRAFAVVVGERGYAETSIDDVLRKAEMSRSTFDANFADKQDLMAAAIDSACAQTVAAAVPAFSRVADWPRGVRAGLGAMLNFLASRPALGHLLTVGVYSAGDEAMERRAAGMAPLQILLENNTTDWQHMPPIVYEALGGALGGLMQQTVLRSGVGALPGIAPLCTYLTLSPFLGADEACEVANGDGSGRRDDDRAYGLWTGYPSPGSITFREPLRRTVWKGLAILMSRDATAEEVAAELGDHPVVVADYLEQLAATGVIEGIGDRDGEPLYGATDPLSRVHKMNLISSRQASRLTPAELAELTSSVWELIEGEVEAAAAGGSLNRRLDRYLTRTPMRVDEQGWRELTDLHEQTLHAGFEIQARSRRRMQESGEEGFSARSVQMAFEATEDPVEAEAAPAGATRD